jgi:dTDP-D-glucose 4,6-dehydratase
VVRPPPLNFLHRHLDSIVFFPSYIHGNGFNKRNYIYAGDVANAFDKIIHHGTLGTPTDRGWRAFSILSLEKKGVSDHLALPFPSFPFVSSSPLAGKVYSIGTDDCYSNIEVARKLLSAFGLADKESEYLEYVNDRLFNDRR